MLKKLHEYKSVIEKAFLDNNFFHFYKKLHYRKSQCEPFRG